MKPFCTVALFICFALSAFAQEQGVERILSYESDVTVQPDSSLLVTESIRVDAQGVDIKHGIYRDFPTNYQTSWFTRFTTTFEVQSVSLDGEPVAHHDEMKTNGVRLYLGSADTFVSKGEHTYSITYRTQHQLAFRKNEDELYWNVTGNGWKFPIEKVAARIHLPGPPAPDAVRLNAYTGAQGSKEQAYNSAIEENGIVFKTTRSLQSEEGLTISVIFPKGLVTAPSRTEELKKWAANNYALRASVLGTVLTLAYFVFVWFLVGRDPAPGTFTVHSEPPKEHSPAAIRYLTRMGFDNQTFATSLVSLAVKKHVQISQSDSTFTVKRLDSSSEVCSLDEKAVLDKLLSNGGSIAFRQSNHTRIASAIQICRDVLKKQYETRYFLTNGHYFLPGVVLTVATIAIALVLSPHKADKPVLFLGIWLSMWSLGCIVLAHAVVFAWRTAFTGAGAFIAALGITAFSLPFFGAEIFVTCIMFGTSAVWMFPLVALLTAMNWRFYQLLKAPTHLGRQALDEIDGFRAYLEGGRNLPQSAQMTTPEAMQFNAYFPYAMALDVDKEWAARFSAEIAHASKEELRQNNYYYPYWYHGDLWDRHGMTGFSNSLASSMSSAISSASTAPGSSSGGSSGGGGGGSSGGGGGGGGGGGW